MCIRDRGCPVADVINRAKFQLDRFRGFRARDGRISHNSIFCNWINMCLSCTECATLFSCPNQPRLVHTSDHGLMMMMMVVVLVVMVMTSWRRLDNRSTVSHLISQTTSRLPALLRLHVCIRSLYNIRLILDDRCSATFGYFHVVRVCRLSSVVLTRVYCGRITEVRITQLYWKVVQYLNF